MPKCLNDCSNHGECDTSTKECDCNLGYTGEDCSESLDIGISDSAAASIAIGYGLEKRNIDGKLLETFEFTKENQLKLLGVCATLCAENNETTVRVSGSRCNSYPLQMLAYNLTKIFRNNFGFVPKANILELGYRRITQCGIADLAEAALSRGEKFPFESDASMQRTLSNLTEAFFEQGSIGRDSLGRIRYVRMEVLTTFSSKQTSASDARARYHAWVSYLGQFQANDTEGTLGEATIGSSLFSRTETELSTIDGFISSWLITTVVAIAAIAVYTRNLFMAIFAGLTMSGIILCCFGFIFVCLGWTFGLIEAIGLTIVVGLTVDYAAHLCYAFAKSKEDSCSRKTADAIGNVGLAILSSAATTLGGCSLLFATTIIPFSKFGVMVVTTIVLATWYAFAFLCPMLILFGTLPRDVYRKCKGTAKPQVQEEPQQTNTGTSV